MTARLLLLGVLLGCAREPTVSVAAPPPAVEPTPAAASSLSGTYRLESSSAPSECGGKLVLAAKHLSLDMTAARAHADVVDRTYSIVQTDGVIVAEGTFKPEGICAGTTMFERWSLSPDGSGNLSGTLESRWTLPPDCQRPCLVRFPITAVRVD